MSQTLYRKYRPITFADLRSQEHISTILKGQVRDSSYSHSYLFTGPRGCGKTSTARIFARAINCLNQQNGEPCNKCQNCIACLEGSALDVIEIDAASNRSIDDVREFKEKVNFQPVVFHKKVIIIDEVHMLTKEAFNALLKTLEEPPDFVVFILATTDVHKVPSTILSRCQRYEFKFGDKNSLREKLRNIANEENVMITDEVLDLVIKQSGGSFRDSESILEKIIHINEDGSEIDIKRALEFLGLSNLENVNVISRAIIARDFSKAVEVFRSEIVQKGQNIDIFVSQLIEDLRDNFLEIDTERVFEILKILFKLSSELRFEDKKDLLVEVALYECCKNSQNFTVIQSNNEIHPKSAEVEVSLLERLNKNKEVVNSTIQENKKQVVSDKEESKPASSEDHKKLTIEGVMDKWLDVINRISLQNPYLSASVLSSRPYLVTGQILTIVVKSKLHKKLLEKPSSMDQLREEILFFFPEVDKVILKVVLQSEIGEEIAQEEIDQEKIMGDILK